MEFNEDMPFIDDSFKGDSVTLVSNVGGKKDRKFSRNYAWAKHAADRGQLKQIVVKVVANGESYRTVDAFRRAVGKPHPATRALVDGDVKHSMAIVDEVTRIVPAPEKPKAAVKEPAKPEPVKVPEHPKDVKPVDEPKAPVEPPKPEEKVAE